MEGVRVREGRQEEVQRQGNVASHRLLAFGFQHSADSNVT